MHKGPGRARPGSTGGKAGAKKGRRHRRRRGSLGARGAPDSGRRATIEEPTGVEESGEGP